MVSGVNVLSYWASNWIWDFSKHLIPAVACVLMISWFNLKSLSEVDGDVYLAVWLLFILYGLAVAPFSYLTSFLFKSHTMA
jgi:ATP-binding cassette subfamily A (ABC1) protein 3